LNNYDVYKISKQLSSQKIIYKKFIIILNHYRFTKKLVFTFNETNNQSLVVIFPLPSLQTKNFVDVQVGECVTKVYVSARTLLLYDCLASLNREAVAL